MAEAVSIRFEGVGQREYEAVNGHLGIDASTGEGEWPDGLLMHAAGIADDGTFVVTEVWTSREAQASFVDGRLHTALDAAGVTAVPTATWISLVAYHPLS